MKTKHGGWANTCATHFLSNMIWQATLPRNARNPVVNSYVRGTPPVVRLTWEEGPPGKCDLAGPSLQDKGHSDTWTIMWGNTWLLHTKPAHPLNIWTYWAPGIILYLENLISYEFDLGPRLKTLLKGLFYINLDLRSLVWLQIPKAIITSIS